MRTVAAAVMLVIATCTGAQPAPVNSPSAFMVFFDWGNGEIRSDDVATLDKVAEAFRANPSIRMKLSGHTDRSGSASTNRRTALNRAESVRSELAKRGVSRNAISVASFGEVEPLVPTEDGVREVQNRRVVIEFGQ